MSITNGVVPARGVVPAPQHAPRATRRTTTCAPPGVRSASTLQQPARVAAREHGQRERAAALQAPAQARILGRLRQPAPERVEHAARARRRRRAAPSRPGRRRRLALVEHRGRAVGEEQPHGRVDRLGRGARHACLAHDERRAPAGDRARGVARRARLVGPEAQQLGQLQRVARARSPLAPATATSSAASAPLGRIAASVTSSTIGSAAVEAVADQHGVVALDDHAAMRWPRSRAARSAAAASSKSSSQHDREHGVAARRRRRARRGGAGARRPRRRPTASR